MLAIRSLLFPLVIISALVLAPWSHALKQNQTQTNPSSLATGFSSVSYHGGPLLTAPSGINIYLIWYGSFSRKDRTTITNFFASFSPSAPTKQPSIAAWWKAVTSYKDGAKKPVSTTVRIGKQVGDLYSLGKNLKRTQIANLVTRNVISKKIPIDSNAIYLVLTSKDVIVEKFCTSSCGFHDSLVLLSKKIVFAHVGDPVVQCPGFCAWPYATPAYGPPGQVALQPPNGVGTDAAVINIATILAGAATNPYNSGYFQGDALAPLEAVTACPGIFGAGAYPGYPGDLIVDKVSKASYNVYGANENKFLVPAVWDLGSSTCKTTV